MLLPLPTLVIRGGRARRSAVAPTAAVSFVMVPGSRPLMPTIRLALLC